jgi:hypothetical protein
MLLPPRLKGPPFRLSPSTTPVPILFPQILAQKHIASDVSTYSEQQLLQNSFQQLLNIKPNLSWPSQSAHDLRQRRH